MTRRRKTMMTMKTMMIMMTIMKRDMLYSVVLFLGPDYIATFFMSASPLFFVFVPVSERRTYPRTDSRLSLIHI